MPFNADCPFCHLILQNVPDRRAGASVECPRCRNAFTLAAMIGAPALAAQGPRLGVKSRAGSLAATTTPERAAGAGSAVSMGAESSAADPPSTRVGQSLEARPVAEFTHAHAPAVGIPATEREPALVPALIAIILAGLSLIISQVPYGRLGSVAVAGPGLILGLVGLS